jgi:transposase-like protein
MGRNTDRQQFTEAFKLQVIQDVLSGRLTREQARRVYNIRGNSAVLYWIRKFSGIREYKKPGLSLGSYMSTQSSVESKHLELRVKELEQLLELERMRANLWQQMVEVAEQELGLDIKKKYGAQQLKPCTAAKVAKK